MGKKDTAVMAPIPQSEWDEWAAMMRADGRSEAWIAAQIAEDKALEIECRIAAEAFDRNADEMQRRIAAGEDPEDVVDELGIHFAPGLLGVGVEPGVRESRGRRHRGGQ
jgi:hypothetical protein